MRRVCVVLMLLAFALLSPRVAVAHSAGMTAILDTEPKTLSPGQPAKITVGLFDAYNSSIPRSQVRVTVEQDERPEQAPFPLQETAPGTYTGEIKVLGSGFVVLRIEATLPDGAGIWSGPFPVETGAGGTEVWDTGVELLHQDALPTPPAAKAPSPAAAPGGANRRVTAAAAVLGVLALAGVVLVRRRRRRLRRRR